MKNHISIVEIPSFDFRRAIHFYQTTLNVQIEIVDMDGTLMGLFPPDDTGISIAIIHGTGYKPASDGVLIYLNGGDDLNTMLAKVVANNGEIVLSKTQISPDMGYYALFIDSEGNRLGLHSMG